MTIFPHLFLRSLAVLLTTLLLQASGPAAAEGLQAAGPAALRSMHQKLGPELANNQFNRPLYLESTQSANTLQGDLYAVVNYPFDSVEAALSEPANWCEVLILHLNTKSCRRKDAGGVAGLEMRIGKKYEQPLGDATVVAFAFRPVAVQPDYMDVELDAPQGPYDTRNYRILLEAVSVDPGTTFIHMGYAFGFGTGGRVAMQLYLGTIGRDKVGFSTNAPAQPGAAPPYIGGMRGLVERNTMRYYLAIDAYLASLSAPPSEQLEKRIQNWFDATEKFPRQLHEIDREAYLTMKRGEYRRQQTP